MAVYAAVLPLITALFGLGCGLFIWIAKKGLGKKYLILWLTTIFIGVYALTVFLGMLNSGNITIWQAGILFLSTAAFAGMFFTIQMIRDIREMDSIFFLLYLISTTGGVLSIEGTVEVHDIHLPVISPILFGVFLAYVLIAWCETAYNLVIARIASRKTELKKHRRKLAYLLISFNLIFVFILIDAIFVYAGIPLVPVLAVFASIPFLMFFLFMMES